MKKMNKKILMIFPILLIFACQVSANSVGLTSVGITPSQPLDTDLITFSIYGSAAHRPSWVDHDVFSSNGGVPTSLRLDLYVAMGTLTTPSEWNYSKQINPLSPGAYMLEVRAFDNYYGTLEDTYTTSFIVTPEPATIILLGFGAVLIRKNWFVKH